MILLNKQKYMSIFLHECAIFILLTTLYELSFIITYNNHHKFIIE